MGGCTSAQLSASGNTHEKRFRRAIKLYEVTEVKQLTNLLNRNKCFQSGESPLTLAAGEGHEAVVQALLHGGACANKPDKNGRLPLHIAVHMNDIETVDILLSEKAQPNKYDTHYMMTPLQLACQRGFANICGKLLEAGADPNDDSRSLSPLIYAVTSQHGDCVKVLLKHGAVPNVTDTKGNSALQVAVANSDVTSCKVLLHYGASSGGKTGDGLLTLAALNGATEVIETLLNNGVKVSAYTSEDVPVLIAAAARGAADCLDALLLAGADVDVEDRKGHSALHNCVLSVVDTEKTSFYSRYFSNLYRHHARHDPLTLSPEDLIKCAMSLVQAGADVTKVWEKFSQVFPCERGVNFEEMVLCEVLIQAYGFHKLQNSRLRQFVERLILLREYGLLKLLYSAGVSPVDTDLYALALLPEEEDRVVCRWVRHMRRNPRSLTDLCRKKIRRLLSWNILYNIEKLDLSVDLKDYVCITDTDHYSDAEYLL